MGIHNELAAERERMGWTQARAGEAAGISRQSYAAIESGASVPSTEVALRLARAMGRSVEELFRLPDAPAEERIAAWAGGGDPIGRRVRLVSVAGRSVAFPAGEGRRSSRPADGVAVGVRGAPGALAAEGGGGRGASGGPKSAPRAEVQVTLFRDRGPSADLAVVGCDPAFGIVAEVLRREGGVEVEWSPRGSRAALEAIAGGRAHLAGAHLLDPHTGEANEPWVRELVPFPCTRFRFAVWEEGVLVQRGNPKGIGDVGDLARPGVRLANREPGSGSRLLLDHALEAAGVPAERISGYGTAVRGHLAVGEAIAAGLADAGVAIRAAAVAWGLDVVPLRTEAYELIVPDHFLDLGSVQALLDALRRPGIRSQVEALQGYDGDRMGEPV